jgi:hypothetical protein
MEHLGISEYAYTPTLLSCTDAPVHLLGKKEEPLV